jgi:copper chaperone CopZ
MKKSVILIIATLSLIFGFTLYALIQNPPEEQQTDATEGQQTEGSTFLEQTFSSIDPSVSKTLVLKVNEMDKREPADALANAIVQYEKSIGRVTADLSKRVFAIEYDSSKVNEEQLIQAAKTTGYAVEKVSGEAPPP